MEFVDWFWGRVDRSGDCWEWQGTRNERGYGVVIRQSPDDPSITLSIKAHRLAYLLHYGPPPSDLEVRHTCDNPPCVNPTHLLLGNRADNVGDMWRRGRAAAQKKTHCAKGHPFDAENTYIVPRTGHRQCRICRDRWRTENRRRPAA